MADASACHLQPRVNEMGSQLPARLLPLVPRQHLRKIILCLPGMGKMAVNQARLQTKKIIIRKY